MNREDSIEKNSEFIGYFGNLFIGKSNGFSRFHPTSNDKWAARV